MNVVWHSGPTAVLPPLQAQVLLPCRRHIYISNNDIFHCKSPQLLGFDLVTEQLTTLKSVLLNLTCQVECASTDGSFVFRDWSTDGWRMVRLTSALSVRPVRELPQHPFACVPLTAVMTAAGDGVLQTRQRRSAVESRAAGGKRRLAEEGWY